MYDDAKVKAKMEVEARMVGLNGDFHTCLLGCNVRFNLKIRLIIYFFYFHPSYLSTLFIEKSTRATKTWASFINWFKFVCCATIQKLYKDGRLGA